jgi:hypothetical protein
MQVMDNVLREIYRAINSLLWFTMFFAVMAWSSWH